LIKGIFENPLNFIKKIIDKVFVLFDEVKEGFQKFKDTIKPYVEKALDTPIIKYLPPVLALKALTGAKSPEEKKEEEKKPASAPAPAQHQKHRHAPKAPKQHRKHRQHQKHRHQLNLLHLLPQLLFQDQCLLLQHQKQNSKTKSTISCTSTYALELHLVLKEKIPGAPTGEPLQKILLKQVSQAMLDEMNKQKVSDHQKSMQLWLRQLKKLAGFKSLKFRL
jgi:hypothetical protein